MKKAFTLIELVAVVVVLGFITLFSVPTITKIIKNNDTKKYEDFLENIYMATENYVLNEKDAQIQIDTFNVDFISVNDLVAKGYLSANEKNPITNENVSLDNTVKVTKNQNKLLEYELLEGDYTPTGYVQENLLVSFDGYSIPTNNKWTDLSGNGNHGNITGATYNNTSLFFDGVDDYMMIDMIDYNNSTGFTVEFVVKYNAFGSSHGFFESSINSNNNYGGYYINTGEFDNATDLQLAMKFRTDEKIQNHKRIKDIITTEKYQYFTISFDSTEDYNEYISMYVNGIARTVESPVVAGGTLDSDLSGRIMQNYPFYFASRAGTIGFTAYHIKSFRLYNRALTQEEISQNYEISKTRFNLE